MNIYGCTIIQSSTLKIDNDQFLFRLTTRRGISDVDIMVKLQGA